MTSPAMFNLPGTAANLDSAAHIARAKWAFTTRRAAPSDARSLTRHVTKARPGDLVLARVDTIGSHKRLQLATGRPSELYPGDFIVATCGARYAPDQFEGLAELSPEGADLLAGGGVVGRMRARNGRMSAPTRVIPCGLITDRTGTVINIER